MSFLQCKANILQKTQWPGSNRENVEAQTKTKFSKNHSLKDDWKEKREKKTRKIKGTVQMHD